MLSFVILSLQCHIILYTSDIYIYIGSGKTTFSNTLANKYGLERLCVLGMDAYHQHGYRGQDKGLPHTFNLTSFLHDIDKCLKAKPGQKVWLPQYDRTLHDPVPRRIRYIGGQRLVLEGLWLGHFPELFSRINSLIFLWEPFSTCYDRLIQRHGRAQHIEQVDKPNYSLILQKQLPLAELVLGDGLSHALRTCLQATQGLLPCRPELVHRGTFCGRGLLGRNQTRTAEDADSRGYVPVEWWIASTTKAQNPLPKLNEREGITKIHLNIDSDPTVSIEIGLDHVMSELKATCDWPLVKLLDIGGKGVKVNFSNEKEMKIEIPPIPAHVHRGDIVNGHPTGYGKYEAYFFPPVDHLSDRITLGPNPPVTRLGFRPDVSKTQVITRITFI